MAATTLRTGSDLDGEEVSGVDLSGVRAGDVRMLECRLVDCRMDEAKLTGLHVVDSTWVRVAASNLACPHSSWRDSEIRDSRFGLLDLASSTPRTTSSASTSPILTSRRVVALRRTVTPAS
ncbi:MAG: hypothetical protein ACYC1E_12295 [Propionibacteriaceae bacterium]